MWLSVRDFTNQNKKAFTGFKIFGSTINGLTDRQPLIQRTHVLVCIYVQVFENGMYFYFGWYPLGEKFR